MKDENYFDDTNGDINEPISEPISEPTKINADAQKVLDAIKHNYDITQGGLVATTNLTLATVKRRLAELKQKGYIERIGSNKSGCWKVLKG